MGVGRRRWPLHVCCSRTKVHVSLSHLLMSSCTIRCRLLIHKSTILMFSAIDYSHLSLQMVVFCKLHNKRVYHDMLSYLGFVLKVVKINRLTVCSEPVWPTRRYKNDENTSWSRNSNLCKYYAIAVDVISSYKLFSRHDVGQALRNVCYYYITFLVRYW